MEHWLADEPVGAYAEPVATRAKRWMRKHPSRVTAVAVLSLATIAGLTIGTMLLNRSNRLLAQQTKRAENATKAAEQSAQMARNAVDTLFPKVSEDNLLKEPGLQPLRKELLSLALNYYLGFIKDRADDPSVRQELADAYIRAGDVYGDIYTGSDEKVGSKRGKELQDRGVTLYEELVKEKPGDRALRVALAGVLRGLAGSHWLDEEYEASLNSSNRMIQLWEQLRAEEPSNLNFGRMLGDAYSWRAVLKRDTVDREGQSADVRRAVEIFQEILRNAPDDEATLSELTGAYRRSDRLDDLLVLVSQITRRFANGPAGKFPPVESSMKRC